MSSPGFYKFIPGKRINDYINLSGGGNEFSDMNAVYIIKGNGSVVPLNQQSGFFRANSVILESGDSIIVPIKVDSFSGLQATTEITQIIYQMAVAAAAVSSFNN